MSLVNEYHTLNIELMKLFKERDYEAFNEKRIRACELFAQLHNPLQVGQEVEYLLGRKMVRTTITEIRSNSEVVTPIVIAPFTSFKAVEEERSEAKETKTPTIEQLQLF